MNLTTRRNNNSQMHHLSQWWFFFQFCFQSVPSIKQVRKTISIDLNMYLTSHYKPLKIQLGTSSRQTETILLHIAIIRKGHLFVQHYHCISPRAKQQKLTYFQLFYHSNKHLQFLIAFPYASLTILPLNFYVSCRTQQKGPITTRWVWLSDCPGTLNHPLFPKKSSTRSSTNYFSLWLLCSRNLTQPKPTPTTLNN